MNRSHDIEKRALTLRDREAEDNRLNASMSNICRPEPLPDADFGESDLEMIVNGEETLTDWEASQLRIQLFQKRQIKQDELQTRVLLHKVSRNTTWGQAASPLTPKEWGTFASEMKIKWGACLKSSLRRECKHLPGANLRDEFDMHSRHSTCPLVYRDVPCYIDQQGNPNLDDYVWVEVGAIKTRKLLKNGQQNFNLQMVTSGRHIR